MAQSKKNQIRIFPYLIFLLIKLPIPLFFFFKTKTSSLIRTHVDPSYRAIRNTAIVRKISAFFASSSYKISAMRALICYTGNLLITFSASDKCHCFTLSFLVYWSIAYTFMQLLNPCARGCSSIQEPLKLRILIPLSTVF